MRGRRARHDWRIFLLIGVYLSVECSSEIQVFKIDTKKTRKKEKCASCKNRVSYGDLQASAEGPYWTFYFCLRKDCILKVPRNSFITPFEGGVDVIYDHELTYWQKAMKNINWF